MVDDGWTKIAQFMARAAMDPTKGREAGDLEVMECVRARIGTVVWDPEVAAALKPYYRFGCKRPIFHDDYLNSFNRDNVHLVDTNGRGPDEITESAVIVDGYAYELDCLVYASGFDLGMGFLYGTDLNIVGLGGEVLAEKWAKGMRTFHGMVNYNFPNLFCVGYTQTAFSTNYTHMALEQSQHVAHVVEEAERRGAIVQATADAEQRWVETIRANQYTAFIEFFASCTPGSLNNEGRADDPNSAVAGQYLPAGNDFFELLHDWRESGEFKGLRFATAHNRVS